MRKQIYIMTFFLSMFLGLCEYSYGWGNKKTHPALTDKAIGVSSIDDYLKTQLDLAAGVGTELYWDFPADIKERIEEGEAEPETTTRTILEWLKVGSTIEDEDGREFPIRARHHFHDPTRNGGLDNKTDHPNWRTYLPAYGTWWNFDFTGELSLDWAAIGTAAQDPTTNEHSWQSARDEFYLALTESDPSVREESLAITFLNLGHVLHLIEDLGIPAHARNDFLFAHYRGIKGLPLNFKDNPLERWSEKEIINNGGNIPSGWFPPGWTPNAKAFSQLSDYWDTGGYTGVYDTNEPNDAWGLAEQSNYQFLSKSTIFKENDGQTKYYFPQPDVNNVTGYIRPDVYFWNSVPVDYKYISGYDITHLARTKFIKKYAYELGLPYPIPPYRVAYHTTFDTEVYEDYAKVTVPRTIDYVTGLSNYFFRGRLTAEPNCIDSNEIELTITNDSNNSGVEQTLKGGSFELYWDDVNNNRTEVNDFTVAGWGPTSTLPYGDSVTGTFTQPESDDIAGYVLIYKGVISEDPNQPDPDDSDAIAMATVEAVDCPEYGNDCGCFTGDAWNNTTAYVLGNRVVHNGVYYNCKLAHTGQEPPNATYWYDMSPFGGPGKSAKYLTLTFSGVTLKGGESWPGGVSLNQTWHIMSVGGHCGWVGGHSGWYIYLDNYDEGYNGFEVWAERTSDGSFAFVGNGIGCDFFSVTVPNFWEGPGEWFTNMDGTVFIEVGWQ